MPMILKGFLLFFGPLFIFIALFALLAYLRGVFRSGADVLLEAGSRCAPEEAEFVVEFHARRRRFHVWLWVGLVASAAAFSAGWLLTALACGLFAPLAAVLIHLRCPACDSTPTLKGLAAGGRCRRCGAYLAA